MLAAVYAYDMRNYKHMEWVSYWSFFIILVFIAGLRYRIGTDSIVYENEYEQMPTLWELARFKFSSIRYEPGFLLFASIPRTISSDFTLLQFFQATVVNLVVFWFIKNNTSHKFLALTFYFIILYLNLCTQVMREALAVCMFLLAWPAFRDGKWWKYYIFAILAFCFHTSAILLLILPLLCLPGIREGFVIGKRTIIICIVLFFLGLVIQARFSSFFSALAVTDRLMDRVNEYKDTNYAEGHLGITGIIVVLAQCCLYPLAAIYFLYGRKKKRKKSERNKGDERFEMIVLLGVYAMVLSLTISIFIRYFNYFGLFCTTAVATWAFSKIRIKNKTYRLKLIYWIIVIFPYFVLNLNAYASNANKSGTLKTYMIYYPYYTRLDPQKDPNRENVYRYFDAR